MDNQGFVHEEGLNNNKSRIPIIMVPQENENHLTVPSSSSPTMKRTPSVGVDINVNHIPQNNFLNVKDVSQPRRNSLNVQSSNENYELKNISTPTPTRSALRSSFMLALQKTKEKFLSAKEQEEKISAENEKENSLAAVFDKLKTDYQNRRAAPSIDEEQLRQDKIYSPSELDFEIAARLVLDAIESKDIEFKTNKFSLNLYQLYLNRWMVWFIYLTLIVHIIVLPFFEHPAVVKTPFWIPNLIEFVCLFIYLLRWLHLKSFQSNDVFNKRHTNYIIPIAVFLIVIDLIQYIIVNTQDVNFKHRFTRALRILFYTNINVGEQLKRALKNLAKTIPAVASIYLLFLFTLLSFTYLLWELFKDRGLYFASGEPYFVEYGDTLWGLYVSITTANFPDIMQPAYNYNGLYAILFLLFMIFNLYLFANMILGAISSNFKKNLKEELKGTLRVKRRKLETAFHLIKTRVSPNGESPCYAISYPSFLKLMKLIDHTKSELKIQILFKVLDFADDNCLHLNEFLYTSETLSFRLSEKKDRENIFEKYIPNIYKSLPSKKLKRIVKHKAFSMVFDVFILANAVTIVVLENSIAWIFWSAFIVEMLLKIYTFGARQFFSRYLNIFDLLVNLGGIITTLMFEFTTYEESKRTGLFDMSVIFRMLNLIRLLGNLKIFELVFKTLANLAPSFVVYGSMLLSCYYVVIMIGMEIFGDLIKTENTYNNGTIDCSNPALINSAFALSLYCKNNFNNILNAFVLMFELMVVNNWNVLVSGFVQVTSRWARLFFMVNHTFVVLISINIVTSIVLEEFWLDCEVQGKTVQQTRMEKRIIECSLNLEKPKGENDAEKPKDWKRTGPRKSLGAVLESYDNKEPMDFSQITGVKFHIKTKRHRSIEMMFQKRHSEQINLARDDIFD